MLHMLGPIAPAPDVGRDLAGSRQRAIEGPREEVGTSYIDHIFTSIIASVVQVDTEHTHSHDLSRDQVERSRAVHTR